MGGEPALSGEDLAVGDDIDGTASGLFDGGGGLRPACRIPDADRGGNGLRVIDRLAK
ncbi:MAG: hypothetical protein R3F11_23140 [Verrucomicrobiales bacterium]